MRLPSKMNGEFRNRRLYIPQITASLSFGDSKLSRPLCHFLLCGTDEHLIKCEWNGVCCHWIITVAFERKEIDHFLTIFGSN